MSGEKISPHKCPYCGKKTQWNNNPYRPFCSERCKLADLHRWLNEEYSIGEEASIEEGAEKGEGNSSP